MFFNNVNTNNFQKNRLVKIELIANNNIGISYFKSV